MPVLSAPSNDTLIKLLLIGNSGTGKTGLLASLVKYGLELRIIDMDNKIVGGILPQLLTAEELKRVQFVSLRDKFKATPAGPMPDGMPKAFIDAMKLFEKWEDGSDPSKWGPNKVLVLDSFTFFCMAAYDWAKAMNPSAKEPRTWFYSAQGAAEDALAILTDNKQFNTNVVVTSHINYIELQEGITKGFPSGIGKALSPKIPSYFEHLGVAEGGRSGGKWSGKVSFLPTTMLDAKTPIMSAAGKILPAETGLADFFKLARGGK
jgi:hypothetical protein